MGPVGGLRHLTGLSGANSTSGRIAQPITHHKVGDRAMFCDPMVGGNTPEEPQQKNPETGVRKTVVGPSALRDSCTLWDSLGNLRTSRNPAICEVSGNSPVPRTAPKSPGIIESRRPDNFLFRDLFVRIPNGRGDRSTSSGDNPLPSGRLVRIITLQSLLALVTETPGSVPESTEPVP